MKKPELILIIDTASATEIILMLRSGEKILAKKKFLAPKKQAEKLLPAIEKLLIKNYFSLKDLSGIEVVNRGGTFTSLRIGVITANALAFALGITVMAIDKEGSIVKEDMRSAKGITIAAPHYDAEPNIGKKKE
ncbi:MAG: tRNA (adenosine(37)-N6)-threonylcarbamoyltransferase complex dimerization subunit type 1 TsaB [Patescibacteria group bacterium]|jgi:tRNA threonylcarbamoyladenosine biosynthesis protein TsaB|nr:tRNA (adenosine(37)-N6)-threonylcarbamoyltransferase complex dimerization subunit type 1 TsaB [Patescibacteria group bacterium]